MSRPELYGPAEVVYNREAAAKYTEASRNVEIQAKLTSRAIELLALPEDGRRKLLLDVGCGSGLSGEHISEEGHAWVGTDISKDMLDICEERAAGGSVCRSDMGDGLPFRSNAFDGCVSISAVQWLCNADRSRDVPKLRLKRFFHSLYRCLVRGARAVLQFYPHSPEQAELITSSAMKAGFSGGLVVDYPNSTKAKKYYLVLMAGAPCVEVPVGEMQLGDVLGTKTGSEQGRAREGLKLGKRARQLQKGGCLDEAAAKGKAWVKANKDKRRMRGLDVKRDSKFTARKRRARF
uniref:18S rRNA (Guanine-N(7))-methyltransferase n=1 Tax=Prasinoderma singulare TaxID=676789 RepID=A0A7S3C4T1_9VIRI|mmetsp:Transcript_9575/g.30028  ORF Transcript_9575/g.30028 Transcript_9575/m.30028 type:complete len:292 (+) Transcript_9575:128-1003(+)|eukprot:CAMPEP_0119186352 /NCGR_PEP_ID=MMETSP1315-20130426/68978_1 /TAXON_ID=676789 /ORGANISM="Prasinoderma singularis, Strain RCC927" /LENGTH=291 /DNA_ID=CAMNT_0007180789 /DNA_START=510 /DNA_END=1385 /DNA_ORIENTATION=-